MKSYKDFITEAPLPDEIDIDIFNPRISFRTRVKEILKYGNRLGQGHSRVAIELPYKNRLTVVKVAMNPVGIDQNHHEIEVFNRQSPFTIPMIDYDFNGYWLQVEKANTPVNNSHFLRDFGYDIEELKDILKFFLTGNELFVKNIQKEIVESDELLKLTELLYDYNLSAFEICRFDQWGLFKNKLVILDAGGSHSVLTKYFRMSQFKMVWRDISFEIKDRIGYYRDKFR